MERSHEGPSNGPIGESADAAAEVRLAKRTRRAEALESLHLTGDFATDAHAFLAALETDAQSLHEPYLTAFANGDRAGILSYFKDLALAINNAPQGPEGTERLTQAESRFVEGFLKAYISE